MKFSEQWLRSLVNPPVSHDELVARLSMVGLEVDGVSPVAGSFSNVVVAEVLTVTPHPDADKLRVCQVSDGQDSLQIVCGAPNVRPGLKVPLARLGAELPGGLVIKKAKLRGVESTGMLCAAAELQLVTDYGDGLLELPVDAPVGACIREYLQLDDATIELGLTPNRGDCLSMLGLAREVGAIYGAPVTLPVSSMTEAVHTQSLPVEVLASAACPRYLGRVIQDVDLSVPTPLWMVERLSRSGIRSIDAAVDITNYVMLELGQPMHAFDLQKIIGGIRVRMAEADEPLVLLDGREIKLRADTLVIADHQKPLAIAGVMGGEDSGVSDSTRNLFLESAFFDSIAVAGKARSYGLHTDSSHRFERGVDFELARQAMERATELMATILSGKPGPIVEVSDKAQLPVRAPIYLRKERVSQVLGVSIAPEVIEGLLTGLGLTLTKASEEAWNVSIPSHRFDISIEEDLIEEVGRLYGYEHLPTRYPTVQLAPAASTESKVSLAHIRRLLISRGYQEVVTYSFIEPDLFKKFAPDAQPLQLANPISADMAVMRSSLWPGLIKTLQYNLNRQQTRARLFETGLRFSGTLESLTQEPVLAGLITGSRFPEGWSNSKELADFYDLKADVESLLAMSSALDDVHFVAAQHPALHPGQTARVERNGVTLGFIGGLHPELSAQLDITQPVYLFEFSLSALQQGRLPVFSELSRFPEVRRDLALIVDETHSASAILDCVRQAAGAYLSNIRLFDVYQGKGIEPGRKSLAIGLTWQHPSRTLSDDEMMACLQAILSAVGEKFGAILRN